MSRHDVTDVEWKSIRVYLPTERNGKTRVAFGFASHRKAKAKVKVKVIVESQREMLSRFFE